MVMGITVLEKHAGGSRVWEGAGLMSVRVCVCVCGREGAGLMSVCVCVCGGSEVVE